MSVSLNVSTAALLCRSYFSHFLIQVYYIVFAKDLILSFPLRPRRIYVRWLERNQSITTFKKWPFVNDFRIETKDGKVLSLCFKQYCSEVEYNDFMWEAWSRNIKGSALKSFFSFKKVLHTFIKVNLPWYRSVICQNM